MDRDTQIAKKMLWRLGFLGLIAFGVYGCVSSWRTGPAYIESAGVFFIPATPENSDAAIKAAVDRLIRERQLRAELAQLLEQNAGK